MCERPIHRTAAYAATKACSMCRLLIRSSIREPIATNGRQDKQDLQDGFYLGPAGAMHSFQLNPESSSILPIRSILSKKSGFNVIIRIVANLHDP
jgi:hypothetical protein